MQALHILNGDTTFYSFRNSGIKGDVLVWREVLSEGPLRPDFGTQAFWDLRAGWISDIYNVSVDEYFNNLPNQLPTADADYTEINLWFEFDLHCQANMLGALEWLRNTGLNTADVYLICPADFPEMPNFRGMGQLNGKQLTCLYELKVKLSADDLEFSHTAWRLYADNNIPGLQKLISGIFPVNLALLKPALLAHTQRHIYNADGLNYVEQKLLEIYRSGAATKPEIYQAFWRDKKIYGMSDADLNIYLKRLVEKGLVEI